jgi:hypothetical protein
MTTEDDPQRHPSRYRVLHTEDGTVLALVPAETLRQEDGTEVTSEVIPGPGEAVTDIDLTSEQRRVPLIQLFEGHDAHIDFAERHLVFTPRPKDSAD